MELTGTIVGRYNDIMEPNTRFGAPGYYDCQVELDTTVELDRLIDEGIAQAKAEHLPSSTQKCHDPRHKIAEGRKAYKFRLSVYAGKGRPDRVLDVEGTGIGIAGERVTVEFCPNHWSSNYGYGVSLKLKKVTFLNNMEECHG